MRGVMLQYDTRPLQSSPKSRGAEKRILSTMSRTYGEGCRRLPARPDIEMCTQLSLLNDGPG